MDGKDINKAIELIPNFIKVCENDLGEDEHEDAKPMTYEEYLLVSKLSDKLNTLLEYVDTDIFE